MRTIIFSLLFIITSVSNAQISSIKHSEFTVENTYIDTFLLSASEYLPKFCHGEVFFLITFNKTCNISNIEITRLVLKDIHNKVVFRKVSIRNDSIYYGLFERIMGSIVLTRIKDGVNDEEVDYTAICSSILISQ